MWSAQNIRIQSYESRTVNNPIPIPFMVFRVNKVYFYLVNFTTWMVCTIWTSNSDGSSNLQALHPSLVRYLLWCSPVCGKIFLNIYSTFYQFTVWFQCSWVSEISRSNALRSMAPRGSAGPWIGHHHHHRAQRSTGVRSLLAPSLQFTPWLLKKYTLSEAIYSEKE